MWMRHSFAKLIRRSTQITVGQLLEIIVCLHFFRSDLEGTSIVSFSDNMAAVHILVNGSSSEADLKCLVRCFALKANCDATHSSA